MIDRAASRSSTSTLTCMGDLPRRSAGYNARGDGRARHAVAAHALNLFRGARTSAQENAAPAGAVSPKAGDPVISATAIATGRVSLGRYEAGKGQGQGPQKPNITGQNATRRE